MAVMEIWQVRVVMNKRLVAVPVPVRYSGIGSWAWW
jgi:hypothetical protein